MFFVHRALFFAIALLACTASAAPLQQTPSINNSDVSLSTHDVAAAATGLHISTAAVVEETHKQESISLASQALTTASQLFASLNKKTTKESSGSTQPTHFRRRVRVVRRHP